jgi:hypothetical protein
MKTTKKNLIALAALATLALASGSAMAESTYGYSASGAGVSATARVTLSVSVPITGPGTPAGLAVYAWTNAAGGGSITYNATEFTGTGPKLANFTVTGSGVPHPGGATALVASAFPTSTFAALSLLSGTWTYALASGGAAGWQAGTYSTTVTYTASAV